jgi:CheY-like chemotaxis protein
VLFAEDDHDTRDACVELARGSGLEAVGTTNGREVLEQLQGGLRPCLIVLDMEMPDMDGLAFRRAQLADPAMANIPVVVATGGGGAVEADARAVGLTVLLRKPVDPDALRRAFNDYCGARASGRSTAATPPSARVRAITVRSRRLHEPR